MVILCVHFFRQSGGVDVPESTVESEITQLRYFFGGDREISLRSHVGVVLPIT